MPTATLYKLLRSDGNACNGGLGQWFLPTWVPEAGTSEEDENEGHWEPGEWMPGILDPVPCERGYHLVPAAHLLDWAGTDLYVAEARGTIVDGDNKIACEQARLMRPIPAWNEVTLRLLACDYAGHVAHLNTDPRVMACIETARRYAHGEATDAELAAARVAAWAAKAAAGDAAWDAAGDAARSTARAAGDAARSATWAAGDATGDAAEAAAWTAGGARDAARYAVGGAWDAERDWQVARLCEVLGIAKDD